MVKKGAATEAVKKKAKRIRLLIMDVDGVLTPGHIVLNEAGKEIKFFDVHDGFGLMLWKKAGLKSAIITAGTTDAVKERAYHLRIDKLFQASIDKLPAYNRIKRDFKVADEEICFIGDELIDLPLLKKVGLACSVSNATRDILGRVDYISKKQGGRGAVREIIELILKNKGLWRKATADYFNNI